MENNFRRAIIGIALASTMLLTFSREVRRMVGKTAMRGATRAMDVADETKDFFGNTMDRMR